MGEKRQYDMMKGVAVSPDASFQDFVTVGYTPENTDLQDRDSYANDPWIQDQFKDEYGNFDRGKFNNAYDLAKIYYNNLSRVSRDEVMESQRWYHRSNPDVPVERREQGPLFQQIKMANPYEQVYGLVEFGRVEEPTKSVDELAQSHKVLSNPTTAGDNLENAKWDDAPNGHLGKYLFQTLVLATYDEDGEHIDPFTGKTVQHKKGEFKLNNDGEFYYEKLDGRSIYGKSVLNKMNILTTDGSTLNKYDFFDSDDIQPKSFLGLTAKELALVGSMFLPYVGPWITGLSVATQLAGLMGTLGKMLIDSDNAVFSQMEGFAKSWDRQTAKTQYAQEHVWCMENMISMIGDVAAQLTEQRFIFNRLPYLFTGSMVVTEEQYAARLAKFQKEAEELTSKAVKDLVKDNTLLGRIGTSARELSIVHNLRALANMDSFMKNYRKIGEVFSKGYMTAITVKDAYGDAISQGAQDMDAAILTLGYSAAEYALLSTGIGEWILPELRADRYRNQAIARALMGLNEESNELRRQFGATLNKMPKEGKMEWFNKLFNIGKNIARAEYSNGTRTLLATLAAATGEAIEEVSEEVLQDFSNSCYNIVKWLKGDDTRLSAWGYDYNTGDWNSQEMIDRYGMSFVGGFFGGGLTNVGTQYSMFHDYSKMTSQQAWEQLCYITRNGEAERFLKEIDKIQLADPNLAATNADNIKGDYTFLPGTKENNQDRAAKLALRKQVEFIQNTLNAEGANIEDDSLLDKQTLGELRFVALRNSSIARSILNEFNSKTSELLKITSDINNFVLSRADTNNNGLVEDFEARAATLNDTDKAILKKMQDDRKAIVNEINEILEGKRSHQFIRDSLFEMIAELGGVFTDVNFELYAEHKYGTKYEDLTEDQLAKAAETYKVWKEGTGRDKIITLAEIFYKMITMASDTMTNHRDTYLNEARETREIDRFVRNLYERWTSDFDFNQREKAGTLDKWINEASVQVKWESDTALENIFQIFATETQLADANSIKDLLHSIDQNLSKEDYDKKAARIWYEYIQHITEDISRNITGLINPILQRGYINTETKRIIEKILDNVDWQLGNQMRGLWTEDHKNQMSGELLPEYQALNTAIDNARNTIQQLKNGYDKTSKDEDGQEVTNHINGIHDLDESPFWRNINEFAVSIGKEKYDIRGILNLANSVLQDVSADASKFTMDPSLYNAVREAINITQMYRAAIMAARTDKAGLADYFGYNATLNEVSEALGDKKKDLVEIDKSIADVFVADIDNNLNKLKFLEKLYRANQGQKLGRQDRISVNTNLLLYKRLKPIIQITDDDPLKNWKDIQILQNALSNMRIHESLSNLENPILLDDEQRVNMEKERIALENAIYDFFLANKDAITDINKLRQFINGNRFNLYAKGDDLMDENLKAIDDNALIWWIASRAAIKSSDFHYQYAKIINPDAEHPIAPIGSQEWDVYNNYAAVLNQNVFNAFTEAFRQSIKADWKSRSVDQRSDILKKLEYDDAEMKWANDKYSDNCFVFLNVPRFSNILFNEGIPGSGKTTAVIKQTIELLKNNHPDLLKKVAIVHGSNQTSAEGISAALGIENSKAYDRIGFMKGEIDPSYKPYTFDAKKGVYLIPDTEYEITNDGEIICKLGVLETTAPCSLIIIDEVLQFSRYDLDRIQKYAKKYGITVLTSGDFDQSGVVGSHSLSLNGESIVYTCSLNRLGFIRSPKLGVSMRTGNTIKTRNQENAQSWLHNGAAGDLNLNYYQDNTGLYGDVVFNIDANEDPNVTKKAQLDDVMKLVDTMVSNLDEGQKIGYIYDSDLSPIFKAIKEKYGDKIDAKKGSMALGAEARYYIIETPTHTTDGFANDVYTGITRAEQASILITDSLLIGSSQIDNKLNEPLNKETIANYARKRKEILQKAVPTGNEIPYTAPNSESGLTQQDNNADQEDNKKPKDEPQLPPAEDPTPPPANGQVNVDGEGNINETPLPEVENPDGSKSPETPDPSAYDSEDTPITGEDIKNEGEYKEEINNANNTTQVPTPVNVDDFGPTEPIAFNMLTHSFNSFELGVVIDKDGNIVWDEEAREKRIDGANGLWKLAQEAGTQNPPIQWYEMKIAELLNAFYNISDKKELCDAVSAILGQNGVYVTFGLKLSPSVKKESPEDYAESRGKFTKFTKNKNEKTKYNGSSNADANNIGYKQIVAVIGRTNGNTSKDILEIPLVLLSSPITLMRTLKDGNGNLVFGEVNNKYWQYRDRTGSYKYSVDLAIDAIINEFGNSTKYKNLIDLFRLFRHGDRNMAFIHDPEWTLAKQKNLGLQYVKDRGRNMDMDKFQFHPQLQQNSDWVTINALAKNPRITMTKRIYVSSDGIITDSSGNNTASVKKGHAFILVSSDINLDTDETIINQFINQQNDPANNPPKVKLVYVLKPKVPFYKEGSVSYLSNLLNIMNRKSQAAGTRIRPIGELFTSYKIWRKILSDWNSDIYKEAERKLGKRQVQILKSLVNHLDSLEDNNARKQFISNPIKADDIGFGNGKTKVASFFDYQLIMFTHTGFGNQLAAMVNTTTTIQPDMNIINMCSAVVGDIYYNARIDRAKDPYCGLNEIIQDNTTDNDGIPTFTIDGNPFWINGKIDTPAFEWDTNFLVDQFLNSSTSYETVNGVTHSISPDGEMYKNENSNIWIKNPSSNSPVIPEANPAIDPAEIARYEQKKKDFLLAKHAQSLIEKIEKITGEKIDIGIIYKQGRDTETMNVNINAVRYINSNKTDSMAFIYNGDVRIIDVPEDFEDFANSVVLLNSNGDTIADIGKLGNDGFSYFNIVTYNDSGEEIERYNASYNGVTLQLSTDKIVEVKYPNRNAYDRIGNVDTSIGKLFMETGNPFLINIANMARNPEIPIDEISLELEYAVDILENAITEAWNNPQIRGGLDIEDVAVLQQISDFCETYNKNQDGETCTIPIKFKMI